VRLVFLSHNPTVASATTAPMCGQRVELTPALLFVLDGAESRFNLGRPP
jgi:hypothetical protein